MDEHSLTQSGFFRLTFQRHILHVHFHRHRQSQRCQLQPDPIARFPSGDAPRHPRKWIARNAYPPPALQLGEQSYVLPRLAGNLDAAQLFHNRD